MVNDNQLFTITLVIPNSARRSFRSLLKLFKTEYTLEYQENKNFLKSNFIITSTSEDILFALEALIKGSKKIRKDNWE